MHLWIVGMHDGALKLLWLQPNQVSALDCILVFCRINRVPVLSRKQGIIFCCYCCLEVLGINPMASCMLGQHPITQPHPGSLGFFMVIVNTDETWIPCVVFILAPWRCLNCRRRYFQETLATYDSFQNKVFLDFNKLMFTDFWPGNRDHVDV